MVGRVVSTKNKNTATVLVERTSKHSLYKKTYLQSKKYLVDDSLGVKIGDIVDFISCRPISKRKSFKITKVLGKNFAEIAEEQLKKGAEESIAQVMPEELSFAEAAEGKKEEVVMDNSAKNPKLKKKGKTGLSK